MTYLIFILALAGPVPQQQQTAPPPLTPQDSAAHARPPAGGGFPWGAAITAAGGVLTAGITAWGTVYAVRRKRRFKTT